MSKRLTILVASVVAVSTVAALLIMHTVGAVSLAEGVQWTKGDGVPTTLLGNTGIVTTLINVLLFVIGVISVIMIIIGGIRYAVSGGNSSAVSAAKNTILYAIVGLVIAVFAYAIVNFVLDAILTTGGGISSGGGSSISSGSGGTASGGNDIPPTNE